MLRAPSLGEGELCKYRIETVPSVLIALDSFKDGQIRFGFKIDNTLKNEELIERDANGIPKPQVHNSVRMALNPVTGSMPVICYVPHKVFTIKSKQDLIFAFYTRMKDYGKMNDMGLHLPQAFMNALVNTPSVGMTTKSGMETFWNKKRGTHVPQKLSIALGAGWLDKFCGKGIQDPKLVFDLHYNESLNELFVETTWRIPSYIPMSPTERMVLREYLSYASATVVEFINNFAMGRMRKEAEL